MITFKVHEFESLKYKAIPSTSRFLGMDRFDWKDAATILQAIEEKEQMKEEGLSRARWQRCQAQRPYPLHSRLSFYRPVGTQMRNRDHDS